MSAMDNLDGFSDVDASANAEHLINYLLLTENMPEAAAYKEHTYDLLRAQAGDTILDVGCGLGRDVERISVMLDGRAEVHGLDRSTACIEFARRRFGARGNLCFTQHDIASAAPAFPAAYFDAARIDRVLLHLAQPLVALRNTLRMLKPGGRLVVAEPDWAAFAIDSDLPDVSARISLAIQTHPLSMIAQPAVGRALHGLLGELGFQQREIRPICIPVTTLAMANRILPLELLVEHARKTGLISPEEALAYLENLIVRDRENRFFANHVMCIAVGVFSPETGST